MPTKTYRKYDEGLYHSFGEQPYLFGIQFGYELVPLLGKDDDNSLYKEIAYQRNKYDDEYGIPITRLHYRDNMSLDSDVYQILFNGLKVGEFKIGPKDFLCIDSGNVKYEPDVPFARKTKDPSYNVDAYVVEKKYRDIYEKAGYACIAASKVIAEHFGTILRENRTKILDQCLVNNLAEKVRKINPDVYSDVFFNKTFSTSKLKIILNYLLEENVSIKDMNTVLETIADYAAEEKRLPGLVEKIREKLAQRIISKYIDDSKVVHTLIISQSLCILLNENICASDSEIDIPEISLEPEIKRKLIKKISDLLSRSKEQIPNTVLACPHDLRIAFAKYIHQFLPEIPVLSETEISIVKNEFEFKLEGEITLDE